MYRKYTIMAFALWPLIIYGIDNPHFYRATNFIFNEPKIEHDHFSSVDITAGAGNSYFNLPEIQGSFACTESNLFASYTLPLGFFLSAHLPVRAISFTDFLIKTTPSMKYTIPKQHQTGIGDLTTLLGWTHNYQKTKKFDFIDFSCMAGVLYPTGSKKNDHYFSFPLGYEGHWGASLNGMASIGLYEWITFGGFIHALLFNKHKDPILNSGAFFKADHFMYGLSCTIGYSYAYEHDSTFYFINQQQGSFDWDMHTLQLYAEYDFAREQSNIGPRIGLFYNYVLKGKNIFKTNMLGGQIGLDIAWDL